MSFHFSLEKLLNHRKNLEDESRKNFLQAKLIHTQQFQILENLYTDIENARKQIHELEKHGGTEVAEHGRQIFDFIKGTEIKVERQRQTVRRCLEKVEEMQELLREAAIEYKIMEKLKEKKFEEYKLNERKIEAKELDEMVSARVKVRS